MERSRRKTYTLLFGTFCVIVFSVGIPQPVLSAAIDFLSDTIANSAPATSTNHTITLRTTSGIPAGGKLIITPESGSLDFPVGIDHTDIDVATSAVLTGTYTERSIGPVANTSTDGITIVSGTSGSLTITLMSQDGIAANDFVRIRIGTHAVSQAIGDEQLVNPSSTGSYRIRIQTQNTSSVPIDNGNTWIAIIDAVVVTADTLDFDPPVISNGLPSGTIPSGITAVELSVNTDEIAKCRYATTSGVSYFAMTSDFSSDTSTYGFATFHNVTLSGFSDGNTYSYYIRCRDLVPNVNTVDYVLSFTVSNPLPPPTPGGGGGGTGSGPGSGSSGPSGPPYIATAGAPEITLAGRSYPFSKVVITQDGEVHKEVTVGGGGTFSELIQNLTQGTYSFGAYGRDTANLNSAPFSTTLTLVAGTKNIISDIFIPPTLGVEEPNVGAGDPVLVFGASVASSTVTLSLARQGSSGEPTIYTTTADTAGGWSIDLDSSGLPIDTYELRAQASLAGLGTSNHSHSVYIGIGTEATPDFCLRSDLNRDIRVNLVDFSILLFHWNSSDPTADINLDERVNLTDFSIMLFCWTG